MIKQYEVPTSGQRFDSFLASEEPEYSRGYFQKIIKEGRVTINSKTTSKVSIVLIEGQIIEVEFPEKNLKPLSEDVKLEILYEDDYLLAINKPAGVVVHPLESNEEGTLVNALLHHYPDIKNAVYDSESAVSVLRPGIVHRLDRDTTGVILIAKTSEVLHNLSSQFKNHTIKKEYLALVYGGITEDETIHTSIQRKPFRRTMMGVSKKEGVGRDAITHIHPIADFTIVNQRVTLIRCSIETGRTHQIRVHTKYRGHPVIGDNTYTNKLALATSKSLGAERQLLHAEHIMFNHPITGKLQSIYAPLPEDFKIILTKLEAPDSLYSRGFN